ncbi:MULTISPECIES: hypothetical protein [Sorangium]|uniref:Secreted protein n=1 Tax=Sorangium cellulosum TaxID=56 RepID=A0A4P2QSD1_SORCE|nr:MULTISPECIES: hypothetical protein [Sorangium]AUX33140.1 uncharacterized protein SOCE836_052940 [Sorangium cellulosum]AUX33198.1 uncharacterized protein SOCE836_053520 [Sorangium cellulosum]WCQ92516.1 hypothetical protein NQZ70_05257 [Sorangium sp. Soce836]
MKRSLCTLGIAAALALPASAVGQEPRKVRITVEPWAGVMVLGFDAPAGGMSAGASALARVPIGDDAGVDLGAGLRLIGIQGGWYHMGVVAGPRAGAWRRWGAFELGGGLGLPYGQLATCRPWDTGVRQCMRWWNAWTAGDVRALYVDGNTRVGVELSALYLRLPWGDTAGVGLAALGSF